MAPTKIMRGPNERPRKSHAGQLDYEIRIQLAIEEHDNAMGAISLRAVAHSMEFLGLLCKLEWQDAGK